MHEPRSWLHQTGKRSLQGAAFFGPDWNGPNTSGDSACSDDACTNTRDVSGTHRLGLRSGAGGFRLAARRMCRGRLAHSGHNWAGFARRPTTLPAEPRPMRKQTMLVASRGILLLRHLTATVWLSSCLQRLESWRSGKVVLSKCNTQQEKPISPVQFRTWRSGLRRRIRGAGAQGGPARQPFGDAWQPIRHKVCSESQLRNTVGNVTGVPDVGLGLAALAVAAAVIAALMPAVVQFAPQ